jgi:imidazolonepropionase-like amidohydrolase
MKSILRDPKKGDNHMMIVKNGRILTMAGATHESGFLAIDGKKIARVGALRDLREQEFGRDVAVVDAEGGWVLPGIVEAHCHMGISGEKVGLEGNDCNETMEPVTPYLRALDAINPMDAAFHAAIAAGITSAMIGPGSSNVVGGQFAFVKTNGRCLDDMVVLEPAAMKVAFGENPKKNYMDQSRMPSTRMSVAALLREELALARQYERAKKDGGEKFEKDFKYECWLPVLNREIPLKAHVHRADDILTAIRIAKEFDLRMTLDHCTEGHLIADAIEKSGFPAIVGPSLASRRKPEVQYGDFKTAGVLSKAGVKVAITTDHPVSLIQYLPICAGLAAREGLGIDEALKAITINAAEICNVADRVGSLAPGKDADVAVFSGNPLEVFTKTLYTIIDGEIVYDRRAT